VEETNACVLFACDVFKKPVRDGWNRAAMERTDMEMWPQVGTGNYGCQSLRHVSTSAMYIPRHNHMTPWTAAQPSLRYLYPISN